MGWDVDFNGGQLFARERAQQTVHHGGKKAMVFRCGLRHGHDVSIGVVDHAKFFVLLGANGNFYKVFRFVGQVKLRLLSDNTHFNILVILKQDTLSLY